MKPAQFEYHAPTTLDEAIQLLEQYQGEARLLAGGQSLMPMMNFRIVTPAALVDLNRISGLDYIRSDNGMVHVGAMTRHRTVEFSPVVAERLPLLAEAIKLVAHLPIRSRGTMGGSLAHADPAAELPMVLQALEGEVVARGHAGERVIKAADLFEGLMTTSLAADEIIVEARFPAMPPGAGFAVEEYARRRGDFAIAAVAALIERDGERCVKARLATAGVGPMATRLGDAETILVAGGLGDTVIEQAAAKAAEIVSPLSDPHASADYRRHLTHVLTARALRRARSIH
ncbi:MAG TPA: xanthine dehydrogenase family protein subunit M [Stellaceae bacterium]|nr:xanthine dehydrogenase family protein subunit M [Stellaceae bacterium]